MVYNQREAFQPQTFYFSNLGTKWTHDWLSYISDDPTNPAAALTVYQRGGGQESVTGYNSSTQSYTVTNRAVALVTRISTSPVKYQRQLPDGSIEIFGQPDGAMAFPRHVFLTEWRDPQGNGLTYSYDASLRLVAVTDALGQVTTLSYGNTDPLKITQITDPFGRTATFTYDASGRLQSTTDLLGLTSSFT
jgi:YD repeat-containing protein